MQDLIEHAAGLGLRVKFAGRGRRAAELHSSGMIVVNPTRVPRIQRMAVAHECGHWVHGHDWSAAHDRPRDERQADTYAARLLITPVAYREAESVVGCHPGALARELGVTRGLVELWRADYLAEVGVLRRVPTRAAG